MSCSGEGLRCALRAEATPEKQEKAEGSQGKKGKGPRLGNDRVIKISKTGRIIHAGLSTPYLAIVLVSDGSRVVTKTDQIDADYRCFSCKFLTFVFIIFT